MLMWLFFPSVTVPVSFECIYMYTWVQLFPGPFCMVKGLLKPVVSTDTLVFVMLCFCLFMKY